MTFTPVAPRAASLWHSLLQSLSAYLPERRIQRPELSPEQRAHRIAMERVTLERSTAALVASRLPR